MTKPILLAEDSPDDEFLFRATLKLCGVTNPIHVVRDGTGVIKYLNGEEEYADREKYPFPSVLFLDLVMHPMDGFNVLEWLRPQPEFKDLLVVVLTIFTEGRMLRDAYAVGADTFLFKPFTKPDMESLLKHFSSNFTTATNPADKPVPSTDQ